MRRPHPFLAVAIVALAVVLVTLVLAATAEGQRVPPSGYYTVPVINGSPVMRGSSQCVPVTSQTFVPTADRARWIRGMTRTVIKQDLATGALTSPLSRQTTDALLAIDLGQTFYDRPLYGAYSVPPGWTPNCGTYLCLCASGIGTVPPQVATDDPERVEPLVAHETANATLGLLQRGDLGDSAYVSSIVSRVRDWIGGFVSHADVPPPLAVDDLEDGGLSDSDENPDLGHGESGRAQFVDVPDVGLGEFGGAGTLPMRMPLRLHGVSDVIGMPNGFKVHEAIVPGIEVNVVDLHAAADRANKGLDHKAVDRVLLAPLAAMHADADVNVSPAALVGDTAQELTAKVLDDAVGSGPWKSFGTCAAKVGNGVAALGSHNGAPLFVSEFFWGKVLVSHREPPTRVPVVRSGVGGATPRRAAFILSNINSQQAQ